jgi:hypothetical protein
MKRSGFIERKTRIKRSWIKRRQRRKSRVYDSRFIDPRSYVTKGGRVRLFGKDYHNLRCRAYQRASGICECGCGQFATWGEHMGIAAKGDFAHNEHGPRKSDELHRGKWMRHECHMKSHNCNGKPIAISKKSLQLERGA